MDAEESERGKVSESRQPHRLMQTAGFLSFYTVLFCLAFAQLAGLYHNRDVTSYLTYWPFFIGFGLPLIYWSTTRVLGWIPLALLPLYATITVHLFGVTLTPAVVWIPSAMTGVLFGAVVRYLAGRFVITARTPWKCISIQESPDAWPYWLGYAITISFFTATQIMRHFWPEARGLVDLCSYLFFMLVSLALSWVAFGRHVYEIWVESWTRPMFRIRRAGPGCYPGNGPLLVIANHACWWDPLFLADALPRPITPVMTANFYDIWHLRPFMKHVIRAIRVPEKPVKHETPEIDDAIAALDNGECVVIFPEGYLRRKEEVPLRRFGRGVWQILKARPQTPVLACWIEGAWGSWTSWKDGAPTKNKRIDIRRPIAVGLSEPIIVPVELLEDHWHTRIYLMNQVSQARKHLQLEPLPTFMINTGENQGHESRERESS